MKILSRAIVVLSALVMFGCASVNPSQTATTGKLNSSDGTAEGASLCLPKGLTHEMIRTWELVGAAPAAIKGGDGVDDLQVLVMMYLDPADQKRKSIMWTLTTPITAVYADLDVDNEKSPGQTNTQWIRNKRALAKETGPCIWKATTPTLPEA